MEDTVAEIFEKSLVYNYEAMKLHNKLKELGWFLSPEGYENLTENGDIIDPKQIQSKALNMDLREISAGGLPIEINKGGKVEFLTETIVLQVMKIRNVAAPRVNEESKFAPRMLKIQFTDGVIQYSGIEIEPLAGLSVHTKPGTKVLLKNCPIENSQGLLLLKTNQVAILGGNVAALVEKWELSQSMLKLSKSGRIGLGGPPPWIAFGKKIEPLATDTKGGKFKSLVSKSLEKDENTEFASQRSSSIKDAIAEANRLGAKKNFGGGNKTLIDVNVQKIIDEGYTEQDATNVLRIAKNNVRNALNILKNRDLDPSQQRPQRPPKKEKGSKQRIDDDLPNAGAPTTKISLFDFLEDKLPVKETQTSGGATKKQYSNDTGNTYRNPVKRYENNYTKYPHTSGPTPYSANAREFENNISASFHRKTPNQSAESANKPIGNGGKYFDSNYGDNKSYKGTNPRSGFKNENYNNRNEDSYKKPPPRNTAYPNNGVSDNRRSTEKSLQPTGGNRREDKPKSTNNFRDNQATGAKFQSGSYEQKQALYENRSSDHNRGEKSARQQSFNHYSGQNRSRREDHAEPVASTAQVPFSSHSTQKSYAGAKPSNAAPPKQPVGPKSHPNLQQEIIGFQNSKTNEHAMNMLKTQQAMESMTIQQKQPSPVGPVLNAQHKPSEPNWAVGEKCLAKYWEDGKFYIAEVTAVTKKTNVVHFLEYGNYEEILKKDCKPVMSNNYLTPAGASAQTQPQSQQQPALQHHSAAPGPSYPSNYYQYQNQPQYYIQQNPPPHYGHKYQQPIYMPPNSRQ